MSWDKDMKLKKKHIEYMAYNVMDKTADVDRNKLAAAKKKAKKKTGPTKQPEPKKETPGEFAQKLVQTMISVGQAVESAKQIKAKESYNFV